MQSKRSYWVPRLGRLLLVPGLCGALLLLAGCKLPGSSVPSTVQKVTNAASIVTGASFGSGSAQDSSLEKSVNLIDDSPVADLQIGSTATVFQGTTGSTDLMAAIPIKNVGATAYSFISLSNIYYEKSDGTKLNGNAGMGYVSGSVGELTGGTSPLFTNTCLQPGETGWVLLYAQGVYAASSQIEFTVSVGSSTPVDPGASLIPQSYSISKVDGSSGTLTISFKNTGANVASVSGSANQFVIIALDGSDNPVDFDYLFESTISPSDGLIGAGSSGSMNGLYLFDGSSSKIIALTSYGVPPATKLAAPTPTDVLNPADYPNHGAWLKALIDARNQLELAKSTAAVG